jgi:hypothetical protein
MKLVTNDYGCGTSSSILDYGIEDVVVVSEKNYQHIFDVEDDLFFIGHDFLFYLWDNEDNLKKWIARSQKYEHWVWCFERIDAIVPIWQHKSHVSLAIASKFCKRILACDEEDCDKYELDWLPQWASNKFYNKRNVTPTSSKVLFSGQAGGPEYYNRNILLQNIANDPEISARVEITNTKRTFSWDSYIDNLLNHKVILNPVGILKGLNTRSYETLYAGRTLLQHVVSDYSRHRKLFSQSDSVIFFTNIDELRKIINLDYDIIDSNDFYTNHSLFARMKSIGVSIK